MEIRLNIYAEHRLYYILLTHSQSRKQNLIPCFQNPPILLSAKTYTKLNVQKQYYYAQYSDDVCKLLNHTCRTNSV